jgi:phosphate transport system permease protein
MTSIRDAMRSPRGRRALDAWFSRFCLAVTCVAVLALIVLLASIAWQGRHHLDWDFITNFASRKPEKAGIKGALWGSVAICSVCAVVALPLGVGAALYLEEFAPRNKVTTFIQLNISNLAAVPSIVYGLIGLTVFAQMWSLLGSSSEPFFEFGNYTDAAGYEIYPWYYIRLPFGRSVITSGLTLMLLILPVVIISAQESIRAVPKSLRQGARALGASQWLAVSRIVLPSSIPGIMTGAILAMSRAIGEAAPLLVAGGVLFILYTPDNLMSEHTAMPLQIYNWASRPQEEFHRVAATGIIVLLAVLLSFNAFAVVLRAKFQKDLS